MDLHTIGQLVSDGLETLYPLPNPSNETPRMPTNKESQAVKLCARLQFFLATAPTRWSKVDSLPSQEIVRFHLPNGEDVSCVLWNGLFHISGTDVVRALAFRFEAFGRTIKSMKKWEEGVFSDLRNLKHSVDAILEEPKSPLLEYLFRHGCIRTQKKQKVFFWYSVPHDRLFLDALERDLKREKHGHEPTSVITGEPARSFRYDPRRSLFDQFAGQNAGLPRSTSVSNAEHNIPYNHRSFGIMESPGIDRPDFMECLSHRVACEESPDPVRSSKPQCDQSNPSGSDSVAKRRSPNTSPPSHVDNLALEMALTHHRPLSQAQASSCSMPLREGDIDTRTRAFSCPLEFCQRPFRRLEHLKRHVRTHTRERPYLCGQCGRSFSRQDNLLQHVRTHSRNGRGGSPSPTRLSSGSAISYDIAALPRSASEWPRQNYLEDSPKCETRAPGGIGHSASDAFGGQKSRLDRLSTAPPGWA